MGDKYINKICGISDCVGAMKKNKESQDRDCDLGGGRLFQF